MDPGREDTDEIRTAALTHGELVHRWLQVAAETGKLPAAAADTVSSGTADAEAAADSTADVGTTSNDTADAEAAADSTADVGTTSNDTADAVPADDGNTDTGTAAAALVEATAVFHNPAFSWIFHPAEKGGRGLCEVPFIHRPDQDQVTGQDRATGRVTETRVMGVIDRLVLFPDRIEVIDYKSDRMVDPEREVPALVTRYSSQLHMYRQAVAALYPERQVRTHLLFTNVTTADGRGLLQEV
jgi:ATP-dependent exoDNAse (exonuclease V) beta subunit